MMRPSICLLSFALFALTSGTPSRHHRGHKHHDISNGTISGKPFPLGNSTSFLSTTGSGRHGVANPTTAASIPTRVHQTHVVPSLDNDSMEDKVVVEQSSAANDACGAVTVTYTPTVTVTVSPSGSQVASVVSVSSKVLVPSASIVQPEAISVSAGSVLAPSLSALASISIPTSTDLAGGPSTAPGSKISSPIAEASTLSPSLTGSESVPPATASSNGNGLPTKRGIIASGSDQKLLVSAMTPFNKISWLGDWYSGPPTNLPPSMQFVPQNYGRQSDVDGEWTSNAKKAVAAGDESLMSFGEPGTPNAQLYMGPQDAVTLFMEKMQPYAKQGVSIGAPGTLQNDQDFAWLSSFLDLCDKAGCTIGFLAMHWFWTAEADHVQGFKDTLAKNVALAKGKPVWVDNFQAAGSVAAQKEFLQEVVPWLDEQDTVARYAYVPVDRGDGQGFLNDGDGKLSELGEFYATL